MSSRLSARVSGRTDVGNHREHNEDNFLVADLTARVRHFPDEERPVGAHGLVLAVCDGMGGAAAGEVASEIAVESLFAEMVEGASDAATTSRDELADRMERAAHHASAKIHQDAVDNPARQGMGTTFTAVGLVDDHLLFVQVGDSRGYLLRGDVLTQVTRDQSLLAKLLECGELKPEDAATFEHGNVILQALGASPTVVVEVTYVELRRGDRLLLCSDGLSGLVPPDEIAGILGAQAEPTRICIELIERAKELGGDDNVTAIVAFFEGDALESAASPVVVRQYGPEPELPPIPDPRNLGRLLLPRVTGGTAVLAEVIGDGELVPDLEPGLELEEVPPSSRPPVSAPPRVIMSSPPALDAAPVSARPEVAVVQQSLSPMSGAPRSGKAWMVAAAILGLAVVSGSALFAMDLRRGGVSAATTASTTAGISTWTSVESAGSVTPSSSAPAEASGTPAADSHGAARIDPSARPVAPVRSGTPAASGSAHKGELAPLRDESPE